MQAILKRPRQTPRAHACWLPGTAGLGATGQCQPPASGFSLPDRTRAREELVSKTTPFLPEGNPRTWLEEDLGALAGSSGSGGEQSPPPTGQGPPFPPAERRSTQCSSWEWHSFHRHPKPLSPTAASSLLSKQNDLRISMQNFYFDRSGRYHHLQASLWRFSLFAVIESGCITVQFHAPVITEPGGSGRGWWLWCISAAIPGGEMGAAPVRTQKLTLASPRKPPLAIPLDSWCLHAASHAEKYLL